VPTLVGRQGKEGEKGSFLVAPTTMRAGKKEGEGKTYLDPRGEERKKPAKTSAKPQKNRGKESRLRPSPASRAKEKNDGPSCLAEKEEKKKGGGAKPSDDEADKKNQKTDAKLRNGGQERSGVSSCEEGKRMAGSISYELGKKRSEGRFRLLFPTSTGKRAPRPHHQPEKKRKKKEGSGDRP